MDIDVIFKIAAIGIVIAVVDQILKKSGKEEYSMMVTVVGLVVVLLLTVDKIKLLFDTVRQVFNL
ncbi:MAG: stage III sporulation protein AC [Clostridia bacterium]|nr:stage III sporulation protein AC [Clostridia bacterium]